MLDSVLAQFFLLVDHIDRCNVVHKPAGIDALVPESIVRERYSKICTAYDRVRATLASDANEYLPLYRLHDVLMIEIWDYLNVDDRHNIAAVSRRFRSIALNNTHLWRFIDFHLSSPVPRISTHLKRVGVAPLHIRVSDHQLNAIRSPFPSTTISSLPRLLPPLLYPRYPGFPPALIYPPTPRGLKPTRQKSVQPSVENIAQAAVLEIIVFQKDQFSFNLGIETSPVVLPVLRSLRLCAGNPPGAPTPVTKSLFNVHTPLLRHFAVIQLALDWFDPVFRNLTYLLVRKPKAPVDTSVLVQVLRTCPSLTYLGLEAAISPTGPDETLSSVELPALQRLYITDVDTQRITAALNRIGAPNLLECDLTSGDWGWFDNLPTLNFSPLNRLQATQDMTLRAMERNLYLWIIEYHWDAKHAVRLHLDPVTKFPPGKGRNESADTTGFIETLRRSPILFGQVRSLALRGRFVIATLTQIFGLFPEIEKLSTRDTEIRRGENSSTVIDILSVQYCPHLRAIDIGAWPTLSPHDLLTWVSTRSAPESGCYKLRKVVVTSGEPLPIMMRHRIAAILDKFLWRKSTLPYNAMWKFSFVNMYPTEYGPPLIDANTPQQNGNGIWDDDDDEWEWASVPSLPHWYPRSIPANLQDDPTFVYCDRALQGRWAYFATPGL